MAATDLVPCFYTGQNYRWERPARLLPRFEARKLKNSKLGKFIENGKIFLFFELIAEKIKQLWDGPLGIGNLLPFAKAHNYGDKLHYEIPHAGDKSLFARHHRKLIHVSSRSLFSTQILPAHA